MNKKTLPISLALILSHLATSLAQGVAEYRYADATQLWRQTDNAAGLALDSVQNRGVAYFDLTHAEGDYTRVQEGGQQNQLEFYTERYQKISPILVGYGSFRFDMNRTKERAWCDVMRPYDSNPYFPGSSIPGKYDLQQFDLTAAIGTIPLWGLTAGLRLDYKVGDLSRLRDPRSRSELLDYRLAPALTYTYGSRTFGLNGYYHRRKEKIPGITTVQQDPNLQYYQMTGLEQAVGTIGGYSGFSREWVGHHFGAQLNYGYRRGRLNSLTSLAIDRGSEDVLGTYKYEPGHYTSYRYALSSLNRVKAGRLLHQIDLTADYEEAYADEYRQQLVQERDADHGYTSYRYETLITFKKRYQVKQLNAQLHYRCTFNSGTAQTAYAGLSAAFAQAENKHLLPTSTAKRAFTELTAEGGKALFGQHLWIDANVGYHLSQKADLTLADATTDYAQAVLLADQQYYDANFWRARLELTYQFPLVIKQKRNQWFVRLYGQHVGAQHALKRQTAGLAFGLYY